MKAMEHLRTILHHKKLVMIGCWKVGLYKQGILHDLSKFSPTEFYVGCRYFQGTRSPNNAEREEHGYSSAWLHHKGRNKHHYEYWIDYGTNGELGMIGMRMPDNYVVEMFMDRVAASKTYQKENYRDKNPLEYYQRGKAYQTMHPEVEELLEKMLLMLAKYGEARTYRYIKKYIVKR